MAKMAKEQCFICTHVHWGHCDPGVRDPESSRLTAAYHGGAVTEQGDVSGGPGLYGAVPSGKCICIGFPCNSVPCITKKELAGPLSKPAPCEATGWCLRRRPVIADELRRRAAQLDGPTYLAREALAEIAGGLRTVAAILDGDRPADG